MWPLCRPIPPGYGEVITLAAGLLSPTAGLTSTRPDVWPAVRVDDVPERMDPSTDAGSGVPGTKKFIQVNLACAADPSLAIKKEKF